ncbi:hypothetical protein ZOSMA_192G00280 [Zostera marina]|uniref:Charged multivesicular body protein 4b n=1 Tax=Zostera marina TaxID=29655 RepID=A0A0K9PPF2_ZOSMR|nr:hypothetical protein ZOSMA_192G00280 [Zostera marina]
MLKKLLSKKWKSKNKTRQAAAAATVSTLDKLHETLEMLEKKEAFLHKKISGQVQQAKDLINSKQKTAAIRCLKKKRLYESQIDQLGNFQLRVHDQIILVEGAKATTDTVDVLRSGASAMKSLHKSVDVADIDRTMEEITEYSENLKQIQDALVSPIAGEDIDEDELEAELAEFDDDEVRELEQLPERTPITTTNTSTAATSTATTGNLGKNEEDDDKVRILTSLQAEMSL